MISKVYSEMTVKRILLLNVALCVFLISYFGLPSLRHGTTLAVRSTNPAQDHLDFFFKNASVASLLESRAERTYADTVTRGRLLNCLMSATEAEAKTLNGGVQLESTIDELDIVIGIEDQGWERVTGENLKPKYGSTGLKDTLMPLTGANYADTMYNYIQSSEVVRDDDDEIVFVPSGAYWAQGINGPGGVIIADTNRSPQNSDSYIPGTPISQLTKWSEAAFGQWELEASAQDAAVNSLKYVIRSWVINQETLAKTNTALSNLGYSDYPSFNNRIVLSRTSSNPTEVEGFYAILGTPNGASTAFLLATHKQKFGIKRVASITVWTYLGPLPLGTSDLLKVMISFALEDVTDPTS